MNVLVKMLDTKDIEKLRDVFLRIDTDGTGTINAIELKKALSENKLSLAEKEIQ